MRKMIIDPERNELVLSDGARIVMRHRWEATLLALLLGGAALSRERFDRELALRGQRTALNRSQCLRVLNSLKQALAELPHAPLSVCHAPRRASSGPWWLASDAAHEMQLCVPRDDTAAVTHSRQDWPQPLLRRNGGCRALADLVQQLVNAEACAINGRFEDALDLWSTQDEDRELTIDGWCLLQLRRANWQARLGEQATSIDLAHTVLTVPAEQLRAVNVLAQAWLVCARTEYDRSLQARAWDAPPRAGAGAAVFDSVYEAQWNNLQALYLRRQLQALVSANAADTEPLQALHQRAMQHLESALFWAWYGHDRDYLQAYIGNIAYHLQCAFRWGLEPVESACRWHDLDFVCADKFDGGDDSAWSHIFFAEFWLDHGAEITACGYRHTLSGPGNLHPREDAYYPEMIERARRGGNARQHAIALICQGRHALRHQDLTTLRRARSAVAGLVQINPELRATLHADGYQGALQELEGAKA